MQIFDVTIPIIAILLGAVLASVTLGLVLRRHKYGLSENSIFARAGFLIVFSIAVGISVFTWFIMPAAVLFGALFSFPIGFLLLWVSRD